MAQCNAVRSDGSRCRGHAHKRYEGTPAGGLCSLHHHYLNTDRPVKLVDGRVLDPFPSDPDRPGSRSWHST
ncbi:MAG: hypothetical protein IPG47_15980 [Thermoflexaceae bacterium]|nr:hypothetical protein [Thermoflexaceae bacterium]